MVKYANTCKLNFLNFKYKYNEKHDCIEIENIGQPKKICEIINILSSLVSSNNNIIY